MLLLRPVLPRDDAQRCAVIVTPRMLVYTNDFVPCSIVPCGRYCDFIVICLVIVLVTDIYTTRLHAYSYLCWLFLRWLSAAFSYFLLFSLRVRHT